MFLRYFAELEHSSEDVMEAILRGPNEWLAEVAQNSMGSGARLFAEVGLNLGRHRVQRQVDVALGSPVQLAGATLIPIQWVDHSRSALFPRLEADLEIASLGQRRSQLSINVRYEPPLGLFGVIADRTLLHRVAEGTVKDFVDRVAKRVHQQIVLEARWSRLHIGSASSYKGAAVHRAPDARQRMDEGSARRARTRFDLAPGELSQ